MFSKLKFPHLLMGLLLTALPSTVMANHLGGETGHINPGDRPAEDIANTLHNLGDSIVGFNNPNIAALPANPGEVCVFCHTPHGGNSLPAAVQAAPLWNRTLSTGGGYTIYSGANFDGVNSGQPQGVSLACLSCHDGSIALDSLINAPGSGRFSGTLNTGAAGGSLLGPDAGNLLVGGAGNGQMDPGTRSDSNANYETITGGAVPFPNLTKILSDDHPISMEVPATSDPQFADLTASPAATPAGLRYLTRSGTVNLDPRDRIRAYPDPTGGGLTEGIGYVECASCHNPHAPRPLFLRLPNDPDLVAPVALVSGGGPTTVQNWIGGTDTTRIADNPNASSLICRSCHQK